MFETRFFDGMEKNDREIIVVTDMEPKVFKVAYVLIINSAGFNVAYHII